MLTFSNNFDILNSSIGEADFLCQENGSQVCLEKQTVFPIDSRKGAFLLEDIMPKGVYKRTKKHLEKMKKYGFQKGTKVNVGREFSDKHKENLSKVAQKRYANGEEFGLQKGHTINIGRIYSKKRNQKISDYWKNYYKIHKHHLRGKLFTEEHKQNLSIAAEGKICSDEHRRNMSKVRMGKHYSSKTEFKKGKNHSQWQGGISFEPYPLGWTKTFKEQIRYRDRYKCQLCGKPEVEVRRKLDVHHKDYDKDNLEPENLVSLCCSCHMKTNFNREYWRKYFENY